MTNAPRRPPNLCLVPPAERWRPTFLDGLHELRAEGLPWWSPAFTALAESDFAAFVAQKLADARRPGPPPPKTHLWAIWGERFVGRISVFHTLDDTLRQEGGHIGYDTVPSYRGQGVAGEMLRQALPVARALGLRAALLTCDDTNVASIRVIERNGGVRIDTRSPAPGRPRKRYYEISLAEP